MGRYFRENADKYLLSGLIVGMLLYNFHMIHDKADTAQLQFMNGLINTLSGALITLITGAIMHKTTATATSTDRETGETTSTTKVETDSKDKP